MHETVRRDAALGFLFVAGLIIAWASWTGRMGVILAAVFAPAQVIHLKGEERGHILPHE